MRALSWTMADPRRYAAAQRAAGLGRLLARRGRMPSMPWPLSGWTSARDLPAPPAESFRAWWARTR